TN
ncbi:hypothetical protein DERP_011853, partial [Dermatophagoides pteronyssinus]